jgi:hypothetical protein
VAIWSGGGAVIGGGRVWRRFDGECRYGAEAEGTAAKGAVKGSVRKDTSTAFQTLHRARE